MVAGPHKSARATDPNGGYYCFHKSGDTDVTVYHMHPFYRLRVCKSVREAVDLCQTHCEENSNDE